MCSLKGEETFKKLKSAVKDRNVKLRIVMNKPSRSNPDNDTTELAQAGLYVRGNLEIRGPSALFSLGLSHWKHF